MGALSLIRDSLFPVQRAIWAVTAKDVGFLRFLYIIIVVFVSLFTILFLGSIFIVKNISLITAPFGENFSVGWGMGPDTSLLALAGTFMIISALIFYLAGIATGRSNISWFEFQILASKKSNLWDLFILIISIGLTGIKILGGTPEWYHYFIGFSLIAACLANLLSSRDSSNRVQEDLPEPQPITSPEEPSEQTKDNYIHLNFRWKSNAGHFNLENFSLSKIDYEAAKEKNHKQICEKNGRHTYEDYRERVINGQAVDVHKLVCEIAAKHIKADVMDRIDNLLQFVHRPNFEYTTDEESTGFEEYARYPIETIVEQQGDCECLAILAATLFKLHGYKTALILTPGHCMAGVAVPAGVEIPGDWVSDSVNPEIKYFVCEATGERWQVGEIPDAPDGSKSNIEKVISL